MLCGHWVDIRVGVALYSCSIPITATYPVSCELCNSVLHGAHCHSCNWRMDIHAMSFTWPMLPGLSCYQPTLVCVCIPSMSSAKDYKAVLEKRICLIVKCLVSHCNFSLPDITQRFLTEHGFIHRDLSTRNILVGDRLQVKIGNPGMYQEGYYYVVTEREHFLHEVAPECIWEKRYSMWSDVWSYGILSYKVVTLGECVASWDVR